MDRQEGYADGLAGIGMQDRPQGPGEWLFADEYEQGYVLGSLDRKAMLAVYNEEK